MRAPGSRRPPRRTSGHPPIRWVWDTLVSYARSTQGGAILIGGAFIIGMMASVGAVMSNYAWREAQSEELRAAVRAAVSVAGPLLGGAGGALDPRIKEKVAAFASAAMPGLTVDAGDVSVAYNSDADITTIVVGGDYDFQDIWIVGDGATSVSNTVDVRLESEQYEVALALDVSKSMDVPLEGNTDRIDGLKTAIENVIDSLESTGATTPGSILVSVVPYSPAVNVADTCNADPDTGLCRAARSAGKERYVRMLAGVRDTMAATLADARNAKDGNVGGHWVDTFHHYGAGTDLGPLRRQYLPTELLDNRNWDLRRTDVSIDVSDQVPALGNWVVDDVDFWNGCVMARWGAYWNAAARGPGWTPEQAGNWPASKAVGAWSAGGTALPATTPLHLSDAPPDADTPDTLFTAYSWPDARISGRADGWMQNTVIELLHPGAMSVAPVVGDNSWSLAGNGGDVFCPDVPISPLTEDLNLVRSTVRGLRTTDRYDSGSGNDIGATYMNLGVVWALRTLSPLWQGVWDVRDVRSVKRPGVPCAPGESERQCNPSLKKSIVLVSDGANYMGKVVSRLYPGHGVHSNPSSHDPEWVCNRTNVSAYLAADAVSTPDAFNAYFRSPHVDTDLVDSNGKLNDAGLERVAEAFLRFATADNVDFYGYPEPEADTPERKDDLRNALASAASGGRPTPWQLFRGWNPEVIDALVGEDAFGFDGRPTLVGARCRPSSTFSVYGRADDMVYMGDVGPDALTDPAPVTDVAPYEVASLPASVVGSPGSYAGANAIHGEMNSRLDEWLLDACRIAGARRVRINVVFIGNPVWNAVQVEGLERCVDAAGGDPDVAEVFVTPTAAELNSAFEELFTIRRNLRFLN